MKLKVLATVCISILALLLGIGIGSVNISPDRILGIIGHHALGTALPEHITLQETAIVWHQRLPRVLLAFVAGAALSVSGAVMQSVL